mmetsp:Transcript_28017/g.60822  ORF Transcript_28017/g.60822 Transcript_28017/m.60822 type:complete len:209 (+) Transcript_28017:802-1428(+)
MGPPRLRKRPGSASAVASTSMAFIISEMTPERSLTVSAPTAPWPTCRSTVEIPEACTCRVVQRVEGYLPSRLAFMGCWASSIMDLMVDFRNSLQSSCRTGSPILLLSTAARTLMAKLSQTPKFCFRISAVIAWELRGSMLCTTPGTKSQKSSCIASMIVSKRLIASVFSSERVVLMPDIRIFSSSSSSSSSSFVWANMAKMLWMISGT